MLLGVFCTLIGKNCHPQKKYFLNLKLGEITNSNKGANLFFPSLSFLGDKLTAASHQLFAVPWGCDGGRGAPSSPLSWMPARCGRHPLLLHKQGQEAGAWGSSLSPWSSRAADSAACRPGCDPLPGLCDLEPLSLPSSVEGAA